MEMLIIIAKVLIGIFLVFCLSTIIAKLLSIIAFLINDTKEETQFKRESYSIRRKVKR